MMMGCVIIMKTIKVQSLTYTEERNAKVITSFDELTMLGWEDEVAIQCGVEIIRGKLMQKKDTGVLIDTLFEQLLVKPESFNDGIYLYRLI